MQKHISGLVDKVLSKGMELMESERVQKLMASPQAQKAMDLGISAMTKAQEAKAAAKAGIANRLGLATRKEMEELRAQLEELEAKTEAAKADTAQE